MRTYNSNDNRKQLGLENLLEACCFANETSAFLRGPKWPSIKKEAKICDWYGECRKHLQLPFDHCYQSCPQVVTQKSNLIRLRLNELYRSINTPPAESLDFRPLLWRGDYVQTPLRSQLLGKVEQMGRTSEARKKNHCEIPYYCDFSLRSKCDEARRKDRKCQNNDFPPEKRHFLLLIWLMYKKI